MRICLCITLLFFSLFANAQDTHFSQFYVSPLLQNPANTGFFNCDYRLTAIYRSQWNSITVPYNSFAGSYDMRFVVKPTDSRAIKTSKDLFGLGIVFSNDVAGDGTFDRPQVEIAGSYHKSLDRYGRNYLGGGILLGYGAGVINSSKLVFGSMYQGPNLPLLQSNEAPFHSFGYFDASAGVNYNLMFLNEKKQFTDNSFQVGAAVYHINQPEESFFGNSGSRLPAKFVFNTSFQYNVSDKIELFPKINVTYQGGSREYMIGSFARIDLSDEKDYAIYFGMWVRMNDAVIPVVRFDINSISLSFSYDVNVSSLGNATYGQGGPEFSIIYIGCLPKGSGKAVFCPRF